jgi:hypothetical protein
MQKKNPLKCGQKEKDVGKHKLQGFTEHDRGSPLTGGFKESWH